MKIDIYNFFVMTRSKIKIVERLMYCKYNKREEIAKIFIKKETKLQYTMFKSSGGNKIIIFCF